MFPDYTICSDLFNQYEIEFNQNAYDKLSEYSRYLIEINQLINLTAITDPYEILVKHFLDSVIISKYIDFSGSNSLIDVGTGAGFPSVPLKIFYDKIDLTLLDSLGKRINFLTELCDKLSISAKFIHDNAVNSGRDVNFREKYDYVCARAVANLSVLAEYCLPFVKLNGTFIALKGPNEDISDAQSSISKLGGDIINIHDYTVEENSRRLILIKKISHISTKYPRKIAQIKKRSL